MNIKKAMDRIEELAKERHMTLGALMDNADLSTTIYQWRKTENREAKRTPSLKSIEKICDFFGISLSYFFADKEEQLTVRQSEIANELKNLNKEETEAIANLIAILIALKKNQ